jgi:hypothetical protein
MARLDDLVPRLALNLLETRIVADHIEARVDVEPGDAGRA